MIVLVQIFDKHGKAAGSFAADQSILESLLAVESAKIALLAGGNITVSLTSAKRAAAKLEAAPPSRLDPAEILTMIAQIAAQPDVNESERMRLWQLGRAMEAHYLANGSIVLIADAA